MKEDIIIRTAYPEDAERLSEIYKYYVENTAVSFECEAPSAEEFLARMNKIRRFYPYFAAEKDGRITGYAYAHAYNERAAYIRCAELTIYLDRDFRGQGLGRKLYEALENALGSMGILDLYALVAYPPQEDEYLSENSFRFHESLGFTKAGHLRSAGFKFGRWYDMTIMGKQIGEHVPDASEVLPYPESALKFRRADEGDIDSVLEMLRSARRRLDAQNIHMWDDSYPNRSVLEDDVAAGNLFVGELCGAVAVCYVINDWCDGDYALGKWQYTGTRYRFGHRLCVDPRLQGLGLANVTMKHVEEQLRADGVESFRFEAFADNAVSLSLYEKHGYKTVGEVHWDAGVFYLMEKLL